MFTWLVYLLFGCVILFSILVIMNLVLFIWVTHIIKKRGRDERKRQAKEIMKDICDIPLIFRISIIFFTLKSVVEKLTPDLAYSFIKRIRWYLITIICTFTISAVSCYVIGLAVKSVNDTITSFVSSFSALFSGNDDCTCYALCNDDAEIDKKSTYELLFGETEYQQFINALDLSATQLTELESLETCSDINSFLFFNITEDGVKEYASLVQSSANFRSADGKDRREMTEQELEQDLMMLLLDFKENGRNPNCEYCKYAPHKDLEYGCNGESHYVPGIDWGDLWVPDDGNGGGSSDNGTDYGKATGPYALDLGDGESFYWYHQTSYACGCEHCGDWTAMQWGVPGNWHKFGSDGCAVYSLAMIASNLTGNEITPTRLLKDMGCTVENGYCDTTNSPCFNTRLINREAAAQVLKDKYGIDYQIVSSESEITEILKNNGMVWDQWHDSTSKDPRVWLCGSHDFTWYANTGHFMAIRKVDSDGNYYCLTSCSNGGTLLKYKTANMVMKSPEKPHDVLRHSTGGAKIAFWKTRPVDDGSGGGGDSPGGGSSSNWYNSNLPSVYTNTENVSGQIKLYNGLPWNPAGAYFIDTDASTTSLYSYVLSVSGVEIDRSLSYSLTANGRFVKGVGSWKGTNSSGKSTTDYLRGSGWTYDDSSSSYIKNVNGINCLGVAVPPTVITTGYNNGFSDNITAWKNSSTPSASVYNYSNKRMALVLKSNNGAIKYLPVTTCDAKGHTFPGGVCQTNVKAGSFSNGVFNVQVASTSGDAGGGNQSWAESELGTKLNTVVTAGANPSDYMYNVCETYGWGEGIRGYFSGNYRVIGYIVWQ